MACNDFTLAKLRQRFGLVTREVGGLFGGMAEPPLPPISAATLDRQVPLS